MLLDVQNDLWTIIVLDSRLPAALKSCEVCQPTTFSITTTIFLWDLLLVFITCNSVVKTRTCVGLKLTQSLN